MYKLASYRHHVPRALVMGVGVLLGWGLLWGVGYGLDATVTQPEWRSRIEVAVVFGTVAAAVAISLHARRRPSTAADVVVVLTSVVVAGLATVALNGTRWAFSSVWGDSYFRTQMATRYSGDVGLVDYGYRDLPGYYPPALGWLQGRTADLLQLEGWEVMKPVQLVLAAGVPLLAYAFWRRVIAPWPAACVVLATTMLTVHLQKPDEWLVLAVVLPWWLEVVRGVRSPAAAEWTFWRHGLVLGVLLLTHTYYFLPLGVATLLAIGADLFFRRQLALPVRQALLIAGTGLAVSAPYWVGMLIQRARGAASDTLQLRYSFEGANLPPAPPTLTVAALWGVGLAWLLFAAWNWHRNDRVNRLAAGLALALIGSYLTLLAGAVATRFDVGLLAFKTGHLIIAIQVVCGVLGLGAIFTWLLRQPTRRLVSQLVVTGVAAVLSVSLVSYYTSEWVVGEQALRAQTTRYPDGSWPEGASLAPSWYPARLDPGDPSVEQVLDTWDRVSGGLPRSETVLVTTRVDLLATTPVYAFVPLKSIYSHPNALFEERVALLQQVARCPDPRCAADLLRNNEFDSVDGLILERDGRYLSLAVYVDNFPNKTRLSPVTFPARLFQAPYFNRRDVGRWAVISLPAAPAVEVIAGR